MKNVKISGMAASVEDYIQQLRIDELELAKGFRHLQIVALPIACFAPWIAPIVTLAATSSNLDTTTVFTLIALTLLTIPLSELFRSVSLFLAALACLARIQAFLGGRLKISIEEFQEAM